ncbi:MAG: flagellar protein FlgN [Fibrobacter sp.]|nr:flagellar protein FlgN [Fibrobacter sp.]
MEKSLQELEQILSREVEVHSSMIQTAGAFNKAIKGNDLPALQQHSADQDRQICQIEKLEERRVECVNELSGSLGLTPAASRLQLMLEKLPEQWRPRFATVHTALKQKIAELSRLNTSNRILIEEALGTIGNTFSFLQQSNGKYAQYGARGKAEGSAASVITLINRTA